METRQALIVNDQQGTWISWLGSPIRYTALSTDTGDRYAFSTGRVPVGAGPKPHRHSFEESFFVVRGELSFTAGNETVIVPANGCIAIRAGTAHFFKNTGSVEAEVIVLVAPAGFDEFQAEVGGMLPGPDAPISFDPPSFIARMMSAAPKYGIDLNPPASAFEQPPNIKVTMPSEGRTVAVVGDVYRFLATADDTNGKYAFWEAIVPPGGGPPPHVHSREEEGFYILEGEITFQIGVDRVVAKAGTFANMPVGTPHSFKNESDKPARMLIVVAPAGLEQMFFEVGVPLDDGATTALPPTKAEIETLIEVAPRYGIELRLPTH